MLLALAYAPADDVRRVYQFLKPTLPVALIIRNGLLRENVCELTQSTIAVRTGTLESILRSREENPQNE